MTDNNAKVWFITGSSTGFGRALVEAVLEQGDLVVATARKPEQLSELVNQYPDMVKAVRLDVTNPQEVDEAVNAAREAFGRINVLVNNAGYGTLGAIEEVSEEAIRRQFETIVFGALNTMRVVLPLMRQQHEGYILNMSSIGGFVAMAGTGIYNGSKFALEGISEALAQEVAPLGIKVMIIEPGAFRTDFTGRSLSVPEHQIDDYAATSGRLIDWAHQISGKEPGDPHKAAQAIIQAIISNQPPLRLVLGEDAVNAMSKKLETVKSELDIWKAAAIETAFEGATAGAIGG